MNKTRKLLRALLYAAVWCTMQVSHATTQYEIGTTISSGQLSSLGVLTSFAVENASYRILPNASETGGNVINNQDVIGRCDGEVLVSGISINEAQSALSKYHPLSVKVYETLKVVSAKFSNPAAAAQVRNQLATSLTGATVTLPMVFSKSRSR